MLKERHHPEKPSVTAKSHEEIQSSSRKAIQRKYHHRREATVYDAVAGRVGLFGFARNRSRSLAQAALPIDVLFRRKSAPAHAHVHDVYAVNRTDEFHIEKNLPESDLLKAIHGYVSEFYAKALDSHDGDGDGDGDGAVEEERVGRNVWRSMDETALLALGILLEEALVDVLDEVGWRAFTERDEDDVGSSRMGSKRKFEELD